MEEISIFTVFNIEHGFVDGKKYIGGWDPKIVDFVMHQDKSPGPHGLKREFFKLIGILLEDMLFNFVGLSLIQNMRTWAKGTKSYAYTSYLDIRPISLVNVLMRILSKVLENKFKWCLNSIMFNKQSTFNERMLLTYNEMIAFEVIRKKGCGWFKNWYF